MSKLVVRKEIASVPAQLVPDAIYVVRVGAGFDLYVSDALGQVAHKLNVPDVANYASKSDLLVYLRFDQAQALTTAQKTTARTNIDAPSTAQVATLQQNLVDLALEVDTKADVDLLSNVALTGEYTDLWNVPDLTQFILVSSKGQANGVAPLNASGKIDSTFLNLTGAEYKGVWNASTNTPTLSNSVGTNGHFYYVSVAGTQNLGGGVKAYTVGDLLIYDSTTASWNTVPAGNNVLTVNGKTGVVVLKTDDIAEGATNQWFTAARAVAAQLQPDWNQTDPAAKDYIKNKPALTTDLEERTFDPLTPRPGQTWLLKDKVAETVQVGVITGGYRLGQPNLVQMTVPEVNAFDFSVKTTEGIKRVRLS